MSSEAEVMTGKRRSSVKKENSVPQSVMLVYNEACFLMEYFPLLLSLQTLNDTLVLQVLMGLRF